MLQKTLLLLLPVTDNFKSNAFCKNEKIEENKVLKNLIIGIEAIEKDLGDALEKNGIKRFDSLNRNLIQNFIKQYQIHSDKAMELW